VIRLALFLMRRVCDPAKLEMLEGDFLELHGEGAHGWRAWRDAASVVLLHSRFTTPAARRRIARLALVTGAAAVIAVGADPRRANTTPSRYTINATDPAGRFTLEFENERIVGATVNEVPIDPMRLVQSGSTLVIRGADGGRDFHVAIRPGGISWEARAP
jgi:hypothetical protein